MLPYQILQQLKDNNLKVLDTASDEFWHGCYHGCDTSTDYPIKFNVSDPMHYGNGVPDGLFPRIINGMFDKSLSEDDFIIALGKFSLHCTPEEWEYWFYPILTKTLELPIPNSVYNSHAPEEYQFQTVPKREVVLLTETKSVPSMFFFEPFYDLPIYHWFLSPKGVKIQDEYGEPFNHSYTKGFDEVKKALTGDIVLEGMLDDDIWIFRDILTKEQFNGEIPSLPLQYRLQLLNEFHKQLLEPINDKLTVADVYKGTTESDTSKETRTSFNLMIEQGYINVLIRGADQEYFEGVDILIKPDRKSVLTCTDITTGEGVMESVAEYVHGRGRIDKKSFNSPVYHGLTFDTRMEMLENKDSLIGKRFTVVSCGLGSDGKLVFPVFTGWK